VGGELRLKLADLEAGWALEGEMAPDGLGVAVDGYLGMGWGGGGGRLVGAFGAHLGGLCGEGIAGNGTGVIRSHREVPGSHPLPLLIRAAIS
jgi:hypothetical protein